MLKPSSSVLRAMVAIHSDPRFIPFTTWLLECLRGADEANRISTGEILYQGQGRAQTLDEIIRVINGAEKEYEKVLAEEKKNLSSERVVPKGW